METASEQLHVNWNVVHQRSVGTVNNNGGSSKYRAIDADNAAWKRGKRPKLCLLSINRQLRDLVASKISDDWSPEQISGWLRRHHPNDEKMRVSYETIYKSLFIETRNIFHRRLMKEGSLIAHSSCKRRRYNSYYGEISPPAGNIIERNFHANAPNRKWLTDISEFRISAGKVYLSPIIDCFDGLVVSWNAPHCTARKRHVR